MGRDARRRRSLSGGHDRLTGIRLKRRRAWDQINELERGVRAYLATDPYQPAVNFDTPTRILTVTVKIVKTPDPMWGVIVGEIIHNLRSALDHLVWELAILSRRTTPTLPSKLQFPIFKTEAGFDGRGTAVQLEKIRPDIIALIKAEQPFATGEHTSSPLWYLAELSNADKHRTLNLIGTLLHAWEMTLQAAENMERRELEVAESGPIQQDAVLYRAHFTGKLPYPFANKDVTGRLQNAVAFDRATPAVAGGSVIDVLWAIANRVDRVLKRLSEDVFRLEL